MDFLEYLDKLLVNRKFKNSKHFKIYYFHPAPDILTGTTVVVGNTNPNPNDGQLYGTGIVPIYLRHNEGKTTVQLDGNEPFTLNSVELPLSDGGVIKLKLTNSQNEEFRLIELL